MVKCVPSTLTNCGWPLHLMKKKDSDTIIIKVVREFISDLSYVINFAFPKGANEHHVQAAWFSMFFLAWYRFSFVPIHRE